MMIKKFMKLLGSMLILWSGLAETMQPGYSWSYRAFRFREAFGILREEDK